MKRVVVLFNMMLLSMGMMVGQPCSIDSSLTSPGIYPDTATNLPVGAETQYYEAVIHAVIPADTVVMGNTVQIDSIGVTGIEGLPTGFTYACSKPSCYIRGGSQGCILIYGTPNVGQAGTYPLLIKVLIKAKFNGLPLSMPDTIVGYKIVIQDSTHVGFQEEVTNLISLYPNPVKEILQIHLFNSKNTVGSYKFTDIQGKVVLEKEFVFCQGMQVVEIPVNSLNSGLYFLKLDNGREIIDRKVYVIK